MTPIEIEIYPPFRQCRFCLALQGHSVFADFDVDPDGCVFAVRVSFDGHGSCTPTAPPGRMDPTSSAALLAMIDANALDDSVEAILRTYFRANRDQFWRDALEAHDLL